MSRKMMNRGNFSLANRIIWPISCYWLDLSQDKQLEIFKAACQRYYFIAASLVMKQV